MADTIKSKLNKIQTELKAPKGQFNAFGKYNYRSLEAITEAVKPILKETGTVLTLSDEIVEIGSRIYVKATATISCAESSGEISATAYAREPQDKKGMDESQITGAASSYARKFACSGLFAIDDTKDADEMHGKEEKPDPRAELVAMCKKAKLTNEQMGSLAKKLGLDQKNPKTYEKAMSDVAAVQSVIEEVQNA